MSITVEGLSKSYDKRFVLRDVSLEVNPGEVVGLLGPNGAGKTTTFYAIMGIVRPESGRIYIDGEDVTNLPVHMRARKGLGYLAQEPSIFRKLTVEENITVAIEAFRIPSGKKRELLEKVLDEFNLKNLRKQKAYTLSGGEKRRCEIARVLVGQPRYLLLDEPFVGIDPKTIQELQNIVLKLKDLGLGILLTDHNVRETLEIVDRAYIIYNGEILVHGNAQQLVDNEVVRRIYLGEKFKM